jgi:hypothetical protein
MKPQHVFGTYFIVSWVMLGACFIWLAVTNEGNPAGRRGGTIVTYTIPVYWILIGAGQMCIGVTIYIFRCKQPGFLFGRKVRVGSVGDTLMRSTFALIGLALLVAGVVLLVRS